MKAVKAPWLIAAVITLLVGLWEAETILEMIQDATMIDVGALLVTGFLAGLFAGLHLSQRNRVDIRKLA